MAGERKFGKTPARLGSVRLKFGTFFNADKLPQPPKQFGHYNVPVAWGQFANDKYSDCVFAGAAHEVMVWKNEVGESVAFTDACVLADYASVTGFNPADPSTDQGTDMQQAAAFRQRVGIVDASGERHKVNAYVALRAGDCDQLALATYLSGACGVGLRYPASADDQFNKQCPWDIVDDDGGIVGGHYVPCIGRNRLGNFLVVTWGRLHAMTPEFYARYCDEAIAYVSLEVLKDKLTPEGFSADQLEKDLAALVTAQQKDMTMADLNNPKVAGTMIDQGELDAAFTVLRAKADASGYGHWITDAAIRESATAVVSAVEDYKAAPKI